MRGILLLRSFPDVLTLLTPCSVSTGIRVKCIRRDLTYFFFFSALGFARLDVE